MKALIGFGLALIQAGRGRTFPALLLVLAAIALQQLDATPLAGLRETQFDRYQKLMPRARDNEPVVVIGIDSQSLAKYGQWPWPRDLLAQLVNKIQAAQPLALGIDIIFSGSDHYSPQVLAARLPGLPKSALDKLPEPDRLLARALSSGPSALAIIGLSTPLAGSNQPARPLPAIMQNSLQENSLTTYVSALTSKPALEKAAAGEGLINADQNQLLDNSERGILRRVPSLSLIDHQPFLSLPLEMVRLALGDGGRVSTEAGPHGMSVIRIGDYRLPTQPNGELLLHFGRANANYYLSAADVLAGRHPPETFKSRFVIIGFNGTGLQSRIITPLGEHLPGIDIHAQTIESLLTNAALKRPWWMPRFELAIMLLSGILIIALVPVLKPGYAAFTFAGLCLIIIGSGYLAFYTGQWLFDGLSQTILLSPVFIALLSNILMASDQHRRQAEALLHRSREEAARMAGELDAATRIQMGLLPDPQRLFAGARDFSVAALLEPARAVGGDYYDCFMLDARRLCLSIGDVSGKGIPASLFMAISKTLTGTLTRRNADLGQAMREVEIELSRENPEYLFVTAFIAILNLDSGELEYVCAGHDAPFLIRNGQISQIDTRPNGGPPLCAVGDYPFMADRTTLQAGDLLCFFTDGVTEAYNGQTMFGSQRLQTSLLPLAQADLQSIPTLLRDAVRSFEAGHPPADDLTLLLLRYCGRPANAG